MANDLTTTDPQAGQRDPAWRALSLHPSTTSRLAERLGGDAPACIDAAIAKIEHELRPVPADGENRGEWAAALDERVRRLAVKVLPTAKPADTLEWRTAMVDALADLPAMISLTAAKLAIHRPFRFIGDIEATVREIAAELLEKREARLAAFHRHREAIERALNPPAPALAAPADDGPIAPEVIERTNRYLSRIGLATRFSDDGDTFLESPAPLEKSA